jgi:hypothetical protein
LGYAVRRHRGHEKDQWTAWQRALAELWRPILASMLIVASGFALFLFSSFPPTRRLGLLVCTGNHHGFGCIGSPARDRGIPSAFIRAQIPGGLIKG